MSGGNPDVSIIIPVYNVEKYVGECLESVINQVMDFQVECILVDDCGQDNSMSIAENIISRYDGPIEFRILKHKKNCGLSAARNTGIRAAIGKYIFFLDSDDIITSDCLDLLYKVTLEHPDVNIVTGDLQTFPQKDKFSWMSLSGKDFPEYTSDKEWIKRKFLFDFPIISWNKLYLRQWVVDNSLFFREGILHEDNYWAALAYPFVCSLGCVGKVTYLYRQRDDSITGNPDSENHRVENYGIIYSEMFSRQLKWDYPWGQWVFYSLTDLKMRCEKSGLRNIHKTLVNKILTNKSVPFLIKLGYLNYGYSPIKYGKWWLLQTLMRLTLK